MSWKPTTESNELRPSLARKLDAICDQFEAAWKAGPAPRLEDYLTDVSDDEVPEMLGELLLVELAYRRHRGEAPAIAEYVARFSNGQDAVERAFRATEAVHSEQTATNIAGQQNVSHQNRPLTTAPKPPEIPGYEILEPIGRGGMGVVYRARHLKLNRIVALKMILAGGHAKETELVRFLNEAEAAAQLQHPNIVQLFEAGQHTGLPYFTLEYIEGGNLAQKLNGVPLAADLAARLVEQLARGMSAAHARGVVHRDLKPANVLLAPATDGEEDLALGDLGRPKITDFGLAKRVDAGTGLTDTGALMGTPSYMAPEQASGDGKRVGPAADVYALGAILYECLTGRPPFQGPTPVETVMHVVRSDPVPPRRLQLKVPRDLETICLKCLEKDPRRRYLSAKELADDLHRYLNGQPTQARPIGKPARLLRWCRRHPATAAVSGLVVTCMVAAALAVVVMVVMQSRDQAMEATIEAVRLAQDMSALKDSEQEAKNKALEAVKREHEARTKADHAAAGAREARAKAEELGRLSARFMVPGTSLGPRELVRILGDNRFMHWHACSSGTGSSIEFSPDDRLIATASWDHTIGIWDTETGYPLRFLYGHYAPVDSIAFHPTANLLASGSSDGIVKIWDVESGKEVKTLAGHTGGAAELAFTPDGETLASCGFSPDGTVRLWNWRKGTNRILEGHPDDVRGIAISPDGKWIASAGGNYDSKVRVWDIQTGATVKILYGQPADFFNSLSFSPKGRWLAVAACNGERLRICDMAKDTRPVSRTGALGLIGSPMGAGPLSATLALRLPEWLHAERVLHGHHHWIWAVRFSRDGRRLVTAGEDRKILIWDPVTGRVLHTISGHRALRHQIALAHDGRTFASAGMDGAIYLWNLQTGEKIRPVNRIHTQINSVAFSHDGKFLATASDDHTAKIWDPATGKELHTCRGHTRPINRVVFDPQGKRMATASDDGTLRIWEVRNGSKLNTLRGHQKDKRVLSVAFRPDGKGIASAGEEGLVKLWDPTAGRFVRDLSGHTGPVTIVAFSPNSKLLASGGVDKSVRIWNAITGEPVRILGPYPYPVKSLEFYPASEKIAVVCADGSWEASNNADRPRNGLLMVNEVSNGKALGGWHGLFLHLSLSPNGKELVASGSDGKIRVFESETLALRREITIGPGGGKIGQTAFNRQNGELATANSNGTVYILRLDDRPASARPMAWFAGDKLHKIHFVLQDQLTNTDGFDRVRGKSHHKAHSITLDAGKEYVIDLASPDAKFDPYLRMEDANGKTLAVNDDICFSNQSKDLNSRILFSAPHDGNYRLLATSFKSGATGRYLILVREVFKVGEPMTLHGKLIKEKRWGSGRSYEVMDLSLPITANNSCRIDVEANGFEPKLHIRFVNPNQLKSETVAATTDDERRGERSGSVFTTAQRSGRYKVYVTTKQKEQTGDFTLTIQEYSFHKKR